MEVTLLLSISERGKVEKTQVTRSSGNSELDAAFASAASGCAFQAGTRDGIPTVAAYTLSFGWDQASAPQGLGLCFTPAYPLRAARMGDQGFAEVQFRVPAADSAPEVRLVRSTGSPILDREAVLAASRCLSNAGVRNSLIPNQWYGQSIAWKLE